MKIHLNEIFSTDLNQEFKNWDILTKGSYSTGLNLYKGMPYFTAVKGRTPLINFHINPFKEDEESTPWRDLIYQEEGRVIYNGDNKSHTITASATFGNKKVLEVLPLYFSKTPSDRLKAPPIFITQTIRLRGKTGFRKFIGFGIIRDYPKLIQQFEKASDKVFSNYQFEVALISLAPDLEFDWRWIDDRRDSSLSDEIAIRHAPSTWKKWVKYGSEVIEEIRLKLKSYRVISESEQRDYSLKCQSIIDELLQKYYPDAVKDGVRFEAMASFVTKLFFKDKNYFRGWVTPGTADRGVDFVGRLDIGHGMSSTSIIVLGQSKRYKNSISGERLTRVASRMTRGYIGVVVTLDTFTRQAQEEIKDDRLPIILINGKKVAELLLTYMNQTNKKLDEIVAEQDEWAKHNLGSQHYDSILSF